MTAAYVFLAQTIYPCLGLGVKLRRDMEERLSSDDFLAELELVPLLERVTYVADCKAAFTVVYRAGFKAATVHYGSTIVLGRCMQYSCAFTHLAFAAVWAMKWLRISATGAIRIFG